TLRIRHRHPQAVTHLLITTDALSFGAMLVLLGLSPLLTLLLLIISVASFLIAGTMTINSTATLALLVGGGLIYYVLPEAVTKPPSDTMHITATLFAVLYVWVNAYYMRLLAQRLQHTQDKLQTQSDRQQELTRQVSKYISPQVWQTIMSGNKGVHLGSTRKQLVVFFSDLKGFTQLSDQLEPETLTLIINEYFEAMARIAVTHGGTIDKFIGDSVMVFFGDPKTQGTQKDAIACVTMALVMRRKLQELRRKWRRDLGIETELSVRMGINTGFCTVGNFGSESRMDYTIMGREVNLASRLESSAGPDEILISKTTHELVSKVVANRPKGEIRARGFGLPVPVYEVAGLRRELGEQSLYTDLDLTGFSMQLDLNSLRTYDKERILTALAKAHQYVKKGLV
ncbi:MAG: adenylate/guanylate cyclase domain-containing protein, partial [Natronospirillum sp.]